MKPRPWKEPHYLYRLGPPIVPPRVVRPGKIYAPGPKWAMLDLLLSCATVGEAASKSWARLKEKA
jgi:hypothetical protein